MTKINGQYHVVGIAIVLLTGVALFVSIFLKVETEGKLERRP